MKGIMEPAGNGKRYAVAVVIFLIAIVLRIMLDVEYGLHRAPFLTLYPTLVITAYLCGFGPGVMVLAATTLAGMWWTVRIGYRHDQLLFIGTFVGTGVMTLLVVLDMQRAISAARKQVTAIQHTNGEMRHRVKNILSIANAIASKTIRNGSSPEEAAKAITGRFVALGAVYDALTDDANAGVSMRAMMERVVFPLTPDASQYNIVGDDEEIPAHLATTFGLVLHELATNALKHGAWKDQDGVVNVGWFVEDGKLWFQWCERCGACQRTLICHSVIDGTGLRLVRRALPDAEVSVDIAADGLRCTIVMPLGL